MPRFTIHDLASTIDARAALGGEGSYTRKLLDKGAEHCAKKLGEEAVETVIAAVENDRDHRIAKIAAPLFHLLVLLKVRGISLAAVALVVDLCRCRAAALLCAASVPRHPRPQDALHHRHRRLGCRRQIDHGARAAGAAGTMVAATQGRSGDN